MPDISHADLIDAFPESVRNWLDDAAIYSAVNHLTYIKNDDLAEGLEWEEFKPFLEARAMAHLTRAEYPIAILQFWNAVWEEAIGACGWQREAIDQNGNALLGPSTSWNEASMAIKFTKNGATLYTLVGLDLDKTHLAFALEDENGKSMIKASEKPFTWYGAQTDWDEYMVATWDEHPVTNQAFKWQDLIKARDQALEIIERTMP